jgi:hypothetical protein
VKENFITTFWLMEAISENPIKNDEKTAILPLNSLKRPLCIK